MVGACWNFDGIVRSLSVMASSKRSKTGILPIAGIVNACLTTTTSSYYPYMDFSMFAK